MNKITKEQIVIDGCLGPIQAIENITIEIKPMTVFIGSQGTGKSLISQLIYFFRDVEYLVSRYYDKKCPDSIVRNIVNSIRGGQLTNSTLTSLLTTSKVYIDYQYETLNRRIVLQKLNHQIRPVKSFYKEIDNWMKHWSPEEQISTKAVFVPAERILFSRFINTDPNILNHNTLPLTLREFARILISLTKVYDENMVNQLVFNDFQCVSQEFVEIEMISSSQMAINPFIFLIQKMFSGRFLYPDILFLHIEEPEIHLHPKAQIAITKVLAYLVNSGFRLVITTHSLFVLYVLNNLILAHKKLGNQKAERVPEKEVRLDPKQVAAYLFEDNTVRSIVDEDGQIDESLLGSILGDLEVEFNRLNAYKILWE